MNEKFYQLSPEKQLTIINAGLEMFGKFDYKKASTELIAHRAGISKGLLFHYFSNKKEFFKYIYLYAINSMQAQIENSSYKKTDDFFASLELITQIKCSLLKEHPYLFEFLIMTQCSKDENVQAILRSVSQPLHGEDIQQLMNHVNFSHFKPDVIPSDLIEMLAYTLDGYLQQKRRNQEPIVLDDIMKKYKIWTKLLKQASYR